MSAPRFRWLVTDLDGTLVGRDLRIVPRSADAVRAFVAAGGDVVIATGRNEESASRYRAELGLTTPMILYNGARIVDGDGNEIAAWTLGDTWPALRDEVLRVLPADVGAVAFAAGEAFVVSDAAVLDDYARRDRITLRRDPIPDGTAVTKAMIITASPPLTAVAQAVAWRLPSLQLVASEATYLEVLPPGVSKGAALRVLAARQGIDLAEIAAIGDNPNDIAMIAVAGLGIAVGDGHPEVLATADLVVGTCADGAVADAIERVSTSLSDRPG